MFSSEIEAKQRNLTAYMCAGEYQNSFFKPFDSFFDAKRNVKAIAAYPIINLSLTLHSILNALVSTTFGVANIVIGAATFDLKELKGGGENLKTGGKSLMGALFYALSIVTDALITLVRLVTHSLATVALGVCKTGEAVAECCNPSERSFKV